MENRNRKNPLRTVAFAICRSTRWLTEVFRAYAAVERECIEMNISAFWQSGILGCCC